MTVPGLVLGQRTQHCVPGKKENPGDWFSFGTYRGEESAGRSIVPHMQTTNAC